MAKNVRLTAFHRDQLTALARSKLPPATACPDVQAAHTAAEAALLAEVAQKYPPRDMRVLARYDAARRAGMVRVIGANGQRYEFGLRSDAVCWLPRGVYEDLRAVQVTPETTALIEAHQIAHDAADEARKKRLSDYRALIDGARTFDDVASVWAEAEELRQALCGGGALSIVTPELAARIAADVAARAKPAAGDAA